MSWFPLSLSLFLHSLLSVSFYLLLYLLFFSTIFFRSLSSSLSSPCLLSLSHKCFWDQGIVSNLFQPEKQHNLTQMHRQLKHNLKAQCCCWASGVLQLCSPSLLTSSPNLLNSVSLSLSPSLTPFFLSLSHTQFFSLWLISVCRRINWFTLAWGTLTPTRRSYWINLEYATMPWM